MALAHILAVLLLRGGCPSVPRRLPPVLCGGSAGLACHGCRFVYVFTIEMSILFPGNIGLHFFRISRSFLSNV